MKTWFSCTSAYIIFGFRIYIFVCLHCVFFCLFFSEEFFQKPSVRVLVSSAEEQEIIFSCFAKDFSPKVNEFKWFKNSKEVTAKISESNTPIKEESRTSDGNILYSAASFLTVASSEWRENDNFTCQFKGRGENKLPMYESGYITYQAPTSKCYSFITTFFFFF